VREGREIRFLFLPDGEDPDSLVGAEGREAFEARLRDALPLSEYLIAQLSTEADLTHADGKAHFVALVRPLVEKIAPGVYHELLLERIAQAVGISSTRLSQWLSSPAGGAPPAAAARTSESHRAERAPGLSRGPMERAGRGSLLTQAIALVLHAPSAAAAVPAVQRQALGGLTTPGVAVLRELLEEQLASPASSMAQTLERWRDRPEYRRLCELAASEPLVADGSAAARELTQAIERLLDAQLRGRVGELIAKAREASLTAEEKQELQALTTSPTKPGPG
jgi:DNA primase